MYKSIVVLLFLLTNTFVSAQELNCRVTINADQVQTTDRRIFSDMETAFSQFLNNTRWTDDSFDSHERIKCNIIITLKNPKSIGDYEASVQIQSARPIYNSNYESILFNFADRDWLFEYVESQPLQFNENTFTTNLTSMLAYYAYVILGLDYDSFSELGGSIHLRKAQTIVNNAQRANRPGWEALGSTRNRYWLMENLNNQQMIEIRKGIYKYHRLALDTYEQDRDKSRQMILEVLKELKKVKDTYPNSILVISFLDAKSDELISIFSEGNIQVRREVFDVLSTLDPSKREQYQKIIK
ncbi:hypothetical protein C900_04021 [Fulvivirga imtechensis AK7]|uniref:DUF4835 domain-containing protein n=1 Tax=Fulvivirga imtechensis AK7 TaxID=1237149 RepID=L8JN28_9BACT|nr:DUF4835 family protein [Fulvivirga imtechensis]ELR70336.1 hypothetical protein C900_04021 [Fulvivirga imtechensis AK7]